MVKSFVGQIDSCSIHRVLMCVMLHTPHMRFGKLFLNVLVPNIFHPEKFVMPGEKCNESINIYVRLVPQEKKLLRNIILKWHDFSISRMKFAKNWNYFSRFSVGMEMAVLCIGRVCVIAFASCHFGLTQWCGTHLVAITHSYIKWTRKGITALIKWRFLAYDSDWDKSKCIISVKLNWTFGAQNAHFSCIIGFTSRARAGVIRQTSRSNNENRCHPILSAACDPLVTKNA